MRWFVRKVVGVLLLFVVAVVVLSYVTMLLWNALVPELFHGPALTLFQAAGLLLLSHILLRGASPWRHSADWGRRRWRRRFEEKLRSMSPEDRERFAQSFRERGWGCGHGPRPARDESELV